MDTTAEEISGAIVCSACEETNTAEYFPNDSDLCVDCQEEVIPDQLDPTAEEIEVSTYTVQGSGAIVCSAMVNGYRKQTAYFLVDKETAIADFKEAVREDLASTTRA